MAMKTPRYALTNPVSLLLDKPAAEFTRADILKLIETKQIERITFHYTAIDGKLKELTVPAADRYHLEAVLAEGEFLTLERVLERLAGDADDREQEQMLADVTDWQIEEVRDQRADHKHR